MEIHKINLENIIKLMIRKYQDEHPESHIDVQYMTSRIKSEESIKEKLNKNGLEYNVENIRRKIKDYIGHRIVCLTQKDVYDLVELLKTVEGLTIKDEKDYIQNPKPSGYRSYHIIVENPKINSSEKIKTYSEIQIRTLLQDVWSIYEHIIVYKKNPDEKIKKAFKELSNALFTSIEESLMNLKAKEIKNKNEKIVLTEDNLPENLSKEEYHKYFSNLRIYKAAETQLRADIEKIKLQYDKKIISESSRVKGILSISKKLKKHEMEVNEENINKKIRDLIGYRIVCLTQADAKELIELMINNDKIFNVIRITNYVEDPKPSGYRGYHLNVKINIPISETEIVSIPAEIQILTPFQNVWAAYEEQIVYHNDSCSKYARNKLQNISGILCEIEEGVEKLIKQNEVSEDKQKVKKL